MDPELAQKMRNRASLEGGQIDRPFVRSPRRESVEHLKDKQLVTRRQNKSPDESVAEKMMPAKSRKGRKANRAFKEKNQLVVSNTENAEAKAKDIKTQASESAAASTAASKQAVDGYVHCEAEVTSTDTQRSESTSASTATPKQVDDDHVHVEATHKASAARRASPKCALQDEAEWRKWEAACVEEFAKADPDGVGRLSIQEVAALIRRLVERMEFDLEDGDKLEDWVRSADTNGSGFLTLDQCTYSLCRLLEMCVPDKEEEFRAWLADAHVPPRRHDEVHTQNISSQGGFWSHIFSPFCCAKCRDTKQDDEGLQETFAADTKP